MGSKNRTDITLLRYVILLTSRHYWKKGSSSITNVQRLMLGYRKSIITNIITMIKKKKRRRSMENFHASGNGYQKDTAEICSVHSPFREKSPSKTSRRSSRIAC